MNAVALSALPFTERASWKSGLIAVDVRACACGREGVRLRARVPTERLVELRQAFLEARVRLVTHLCVCARTRVCAATLSTTYALAVCVCVCA